jgi:hypothetical protein
MPYQVYCCLLSMKIAFRMAVFDWDPSQWQARCELQKEMASSTLVSYDPYSDMILTVPATCTSTDLRLWQKNAKNHECWLVVTTGI